MTQHVITITIVVEVPDDEDTHDTDVDALESAVNDMLDEGTLQDWILDAAADHDGTSSDVESVSASCTIEEKETPTS